MIHDDPVRDIPFVSRGLRKSAIPEGGPNCAWIYHTRRRRGSVTKGISRVRVSKAALHCRLRPTWPGLLPFSSKPAIRHAQSLPAYR